MQKQKKTFEEILSELHPWWRTAYEHGKLNDSWFMLKKDTEQHSAWQAYFDKLGWAPLAFVQQVEKMTMPCEWPEWMPEVPKPPPKRQRYEKKQGSEGDARVQTRPAAQRLEDWT